MVGYLGVHCGGERVEEGGGEREVLGGEFFREIFDFDWIVPVNSVV